MMPGNHPAAPRGSFHALAWLQDCFMQGADAITARYRSAAPPRENLENSRIVAHRGLYDNVQVFENTLPAFDAVLDAGIWGLEFDVRWTRDRIAVVHHDPDGRRLLGFERPIETLTYRELQQICPLIPTLETVVPRYGKRLHFMIEVKDAPRARWRQINRSLSAALASLEPGHDFHIMSLSLDLLAGIDAVPRQACLPIAGLDVRAASRAVTAYGYGGLTAHYAVISRRRVAALHRQGLGIGTGFINSRGCLFREMARGVDWLFSDRALDLRRIVARGTEGL